MSSELPILATHQPTWHTPTTEPSKTISHSPLINLQQMLNADRIYSRHSPGVDLTLTRNGSQNGDLPQTPISLSVRDTNKINSLPPSALDGTDRAVELTKVASPGLQENSSTSKNINRKPTKRVDSILERLNVTSASEKSAQSVIVTATSSSHDENSNSSQGTGTIPSISTPTLVREEDVVSPASNEDSLDSNKSRRKRKPSKTIKVTKEGDISESPEVEQTSVPSEVPQEVVTPTPPLAPVPVETEKSVEPESSSEPIAQSTTEEIPNKSPTRRRSSSEPPSSPPSSNKTRRKTVSESETIDNIAAMVVATEVPPLPIIPEPNKKDTEPAVNLVAEMQESTPPAKPVSVIMRDHSSNSGDSQHSVSTNEGQILGINEESIEKVDIPETPLLITAAQKKGESQHFVAVEDELEKMFAGIGDSESDIQQTDPLASEPSGSQQIQNLVENVTSTSNDVSTISKNTQKRGRPKMGQTKNLSRRPSDSNSTESTPRKKHKANKKRDDSEESSNKKQTQTKLKKGKKNQAKNQINSKTDLVKDIYSYDSGSNASSSRSKGPFIQIRGPRDSPISVNIVNTPSNDDDPEKPGKQVKNKKFHDDSEYRHKVRSKGLHCSTLSNKYDAQTRDATWICVFCKRGPHATDPLLPGPSPFTLNQPQYSPGDLFGPYSISTDCPEYQRRIDDPLDTLFKSKRSAAIVLNMTSEMTKSSKKNKKRQISESNRDSIDSTDLNKDVMLGIAEISANSYEVWVHEDCVIWGPGVYLVGPKIIGLEGAVWSSCSIICKCCGLKGATVCCLKRGCGCVMHVGCAKLSNWKLDEENYKAYCKEHSLP